MNRIDSSHNIIYRQIQNQIQNTTWRNITKIAYNNQANRLTLFRLFLLQLNIESLVLESFLYPIKQSPKTPQPEARAENTDFTRLFAH